LLDSSTTKASWPQPILSAHSVLALIDHSPFETKMTLDNGSSVVQGEVVPFLALDITLLSIVLKMGSSLQAKIQLVLSKLEPLNFVMTYFTKLFKHNVIPHIYVIGFRTAFHFGKIILYCFCHSIYVPPRFVSQVYLISLISMFHLGSMRAWQRTEHGAYY
jgi:hypothetical protein